MKTYCICICDVSDGANNYNNAVKLFFYVWNTFIKNFFPKSLPNPAIDIDTVIVKTFRDTVPLFV